MAKRKKKARTAARKTARRAVKAKARKSAKVKARSGGRAKKTAQPRKHRKARVMHCPAVYVEGVADSARLPEHDGEGNIITKPDERHCGKTKTKGPRYNYLCEEHKHLSTAAKKTGLIDSGALPPSVNEQASAQPSAAPQPIIEGKEVAVEPPPVVNPSTPEEQAEVAAEVEAAEASDAAIPAAGLNGSGAGSDLHEEDDTTPPAVA